MNYLSNYINFYSGKNRKEIYTNFCRLIDSLRTSSFDSFQTLFTHDCVADVSMTGHGKGIDDIVRLLRWPGPEMDIKKNHYIEFCCQKPWKYGSAECLCSMYFCK